MEDMTLNPGASDDRAVKGQLFTMKLMFAAIQASPYGMVRLAVR